MGYAEGKTWRRQWHPTPVLLPGKSRGRASSRGGAWKAAVHGVAEGQTRLSDFTFTFHFHALEKEMATHPSVLAWRIQGKGEPGGLLSIWLHRVWHDWSDLAAAEGKTRSIVNGLVKEEKNDNERSFLRCCTEDHVFHYFWKTCWEILLFMYST